MPNAPKHHVDTIDPNIRSVIERDLELTAGPASASQANTWFLKYVLEPGDTIGAPGHQTTVTERTIVGFIDDQPHANWEHPCRHVHYSAADGARIAIVHARLPPVMRRFRDHHVPVIVPVGAPRRTAPQPPPPPAIPPKRAIRGERYAIIFAGGVPNPRHLHDAEFCWRLLVEAYGFLPDNIHVLNYKGTWEIDDGVLHTGHDGQLQWPGDNSHFRMTITGPGTRPGFQAACNDLAGRIKADDLLFLFMGNHGRHTDRGSSLIVPDDHAPTHWGNYFATDLAADLGTLPKHRALIAVMQQCASGGFVAPILAATTAAQASVAAACNDSGVSHHCEEWDPFAVNWIQAVWGPSCPYQPYPSRPGTDADTDANHSVTSQEAFDYCAARNADGPPLTSCFGPDDGPLLRESQPGAASALSLDLKYVD